MPDDQLSDPLGRRFVLQDRTWFAHILRGHPEIAECRQLVCNAVTSPFEVRLSISDPDCRLYFGHGPRSGVIMMVVGDVLAGVVKTAHLAKRVSGGDVEWSQQTS